MILVHRAGQTEVVNGVPIPPLSDVVKLYETVASAAGAFGHVPVAAIALNTRHLNEAEAKKAIAQTETETGLACTDPVRFGAGRLLDAVMQN
jgi:uncharacterized NAD-dependent epimerase/dehydratase family protein